jgi:hypothetical protein
MPTRFMLACAALAAAATAQATTFHTIPAAYATAEANSLEWVAGTGSAVRQQTLIGASHLQALLGRELLALEIRRAAYNQAFQGATCDWTVHLSHTQRAPLQAETTFAANVGADDTVVYQGQMTAPASPANTSNSIPWTANNVIRVVFQTPFVYTGGTLCLDIQGLPIPGQTSPWWVGDAVWETGLAGSVVEVGQGCGLYGGPTKRWSAADPQTLLPGANAQFWAEGAPNTLALAVFGAQAPAPIPLQAFGLPAPNCSVHVDPSLVLSVVPTFYLPQFHPLWQEGRADVTLRLPAAPWIFGFTLTTQWFDLNQPATSNALRWTVGGTLPTLDLAHLDGVPGAATGNLTVHLAPVYRFEVR